MDPFAILGTALAIGGGVQSIFGNERAKEQLKKQQQINKTITAESQKLEALRKQQATNEYTRATRDVMRNAQIARATALTNATSQGAAQSTALQGAYGQIAGQAGVLNTSISGNYDLGQQTFDINSNISALQGQSNYLGARAQANSQRGQGLMQLGQSVVGNSDKLTNIVAGIKAIGA